MKRLYYFISILIIFIIIAIIISPQKYTVAFLDGLKIWSLILLPTIFPFLFFTKILTSLGTLEVISHRFTFIQKIFKTPPISGYAFLISTLSGYPVGAKVVSDLYDNKSITKQDAFKMTTFTSNSGPMFIYGSVGIGMFFSRSLGLIMLFSHILGAISNGILYRNHKEKMKKAQIQEHNKTNKELSLANSMTDSILSILLIGGFVCVFFVLIEIINNLQIFFYFSILLGNIFNIDFNIFLSVFNGLLEITHGCLDITKTIQNEFLAVVLCTGIITFGGIATMFQAFAFLQKIGMRISFFIKQKITQTIFASLYCVILMLIFY